jgi:hypothetical protein
MLDQSINRSQNHGGDQIYTVEVLDSEHFYSPRDKNEYYSSFPEPWNKQPRNDIKAEIEIKSLDSIKKYLLQRTPGWFILCVAPSGNPSYS